MQWALIGVLGYALLVAFAFGLCKAATIGDMNGRAAS